MTHTILFDVDQTLLYTGGAGSAAMARAFQQLYGIENGFQAIEYSGRTDWYILKEGLAHHGLDDELANFDQTLPRFIETYLEHLPNTLRDTPGGHIKPGVPELLDALAARAEEDGDVRLGLATGNFKRACLLKLDFFELDAHLKDGGFGDDAEDRGELVGKALARVNGSNGTEARARASGPLQANNAWVIGDTPRDIEAARANNVRSLGVATGASTVDDLLAAGADVALKDLSDTEEVLRTLLG